MNAPLRKAGVVILVLFGLLFANLNWVQAYKADDYRTSDYNRRVVVARRPAAARAAGRSPLHQRWLAEATASVSRPRSSSGASSTTSDPPGSNRAAASATAAARSGT